MVSFYGFDKQLIRVETFAKIAQIATNKPLFHRAISSAFGFWTFVIDSGIRGFGDSSFLKASPYQQLKSPNAQARNNSETRIPESTTKPETRMETFD
jgi:hypothetical protein